MKVDFCLIVVFIAAVSSLPKIKDELDDTRGDPQQQIDVIHLLYRITEPIPEKFEKLYFAAHNYKPGEQLSNYKDNGNAVQQLLREINDQRLLEKKHWFSLFDDRHRQEALYLFEVLINAKDWETFYSSAAYFREIVNEGVFVYAFSVSVIHSNLTKALILPPLYEITPHMFANFDVINKAYTAQMTRTPGTFRMNFTGTKKNSEQRVAYFGEDIGMNVHHVSWHYQLPFWWIDSYGEALDRKGELFFWTHHQLNARYNAERLSNYLNPIEELYWDKPIKDGFAPHAIYKYDGNFPFRPDNAKFEDIDDVINIYELKAYESRIRDATAHGKVKHANGSDINILGKNGIDVLGNIIESSKYSVNPQFYGSLHNLAHVVLGRQGDPNGKYGLPPSVMEHFETATRDPAFFRLHEYINHLFLEHKDSLPPYTKKDIHFPEVSVEKVEILGSLSTMFEDFEFDLSQGVDHESESDNIQIKAVIKRINYEPFKFEITLNNNGNEKVLATFRLYLCPEEDANGVEYTFEEARWRCMEMDKFWRILDSGRNVIERDSRHSSITTKDSLSYKYIEDLCNELIEKNQKLPPFWFSHRSCGFPNRFLLPKGKQEGMNFSLIVAVTNGYSDAAYEGLEKADLYNNGLCGILKKQYPDTSPLGFPFDRRIPDEKAFFELPNIFRKTVTITHNP